MIHDEATTLAAVGGQEPPDGTKLAVYGGEGQWRVIWRDDEEAKLWYEGDARGQNWFDEPDSDPMGLHQHLQYAHSVYLLGEPIGVLP
jgi:hypothetical protein